MTSIFEYTDRLNNPYEAFFLDTAKHFFPNVPHWHYFIEIIYVTKGTADMVVDGRKYLLKAGSLIVFHPQAVHEVFFTVDHPVCYYVLKFDPVHLNIPGSNLPPLSEILRMVKEYPQLSIYFTGEELRGIPIETWLDKTCKILLRKDFGYDIQVHSYCTLLITELLNLWKQQGFHLTPKEKCFSLNDRFASVAEYIYQNCQNPISVQEIAESFHMSYSHFAMKFKAYYGQTCSQFLKTSRIRKAEDLLRFTDFDLAYISQETGFSDSSHLIRVFKEFHNMTPKQFRNHTT